MRMKRIFLIILLLLPIGCFGGGGQTTGIPTLSSETYDLYETSAYLIQYPKGWKLRTDFPANIDAYTQVAFISNIKEVFFTPTVTVAVENISDGVLTKDFAQKIIDQNGKSLLNYNLIDKNEVVIDEAGNITYLIEFQGKNNPEDNLIDYLQTYFVADGKGFVVTGARDPNGDPILAERLLDTVRSFRLR